VPRSEPDRHKPRSPEDDTQMDSDNRDKDVDDTDCYTENVLPNSEDPHSITQDSKNHLV
jgi:hypothetical protein